MASSYTPLLRLTLPTTGELQGTWGDTVNNGITSLTEAAIAGTAAIVMSDANHTLTVANGATDEARRMFVTLTGALTATRNVICPAVSKMYVVRNNTTGGQSIVFKTSAGTGITVANGRSALLYCDGTNVVEAFSAFGGNAATATALQTTRTLWGQNFNGTANVTGALSSVTTLSMSGQLTNTVATGTAPLVVSSTTRVANLNVATAGTADTLTTTRTLWGQNFNGAANVTGALSGVTDITASGSVTLSGGTANGVAYLNGSKVLTTGSALTFDGTNLGVGTSSPTQKLHVYGGAALTMARIEATTDSAYLNLRTANRSYNIFSEYSTSGLVFFDVTAGAERLRIDSSGNLGLGVTPRAWATVVPAIQLGSAGAFLAAQGSSTNVRMGVNAYYNGGYIYTISGAASMYQQAAGVHSWYTAPSGTAGNAISFTQAMTLDASGNLGVGSTSISPAYGYSRVIEVAGQFPGIKFAPSGSSTFGFQIGAGTGGFQFYDVTAMSERMRIDSAGNVGIGTSSPTEMLDIGSGNAVQNIVLRRNSVATGTGLYQGQIAFGGYSTGTTVVKGSAIQGFSDGAWTSTSAPGYLNFYTTAVNSTTLTQRMRLASNGDLSLQGGNLLFGSSALVAAGAGFALRLGANNTEHMRIDSAGNVGIGTSSPGDKLELGGNGSGIILRSPNGTRYRLTVTDLGVLSVTAV